MKNFSIKPEELFRHEVQNHIVDTKDFGKLNYVNLDNAATTPPFKCVEEHVTNYLASYGSVHRGAGTKSKVSTDEYERSREYIKKFVKAPDDSYVILTGNTTGAMNAAAYFFSYLEGKVAVSSIEHSSSWLPWIMAEGIKKLGSKQMNLSQLDEANEQIQKLGREQVVRYDVNDQFEFDLEDIRELFKGNKVKAFVLTASSNATGYCPDIKAIGEIVHANNAMFIVDACQYIQHHKIDMQELGIDFLAASGHKFYAPYGAGFLIGPKKFLDKFLPYQIGGGNLPYITKEGEFLRYENQLAHDPGTPNAVGMVAMARALKELEDIGLENVKAYEKSLTKQAYEALKQIPKVRLLVNEKHLNTVVPFVIEGLTPRETAETLNERFGVGVRAGSFCVYNVVRTLFGIEDETAIIEGVKKGDKSVIPGFVRASFALCNTQEDVDRFVGAIKEIAR